MKIPFQTVGYIEAYEIIPAAMLEWTLKGADDRFVIDTGQIVAITARTEDRFGQSVPMGKDSWE